MRTSPDKTDLLDTLPSATWNSQKNEWQNLISGANIALDDNGGPDNDLNMMGKASSAYASAGASYQDSGSGGSYILTLSTNTLQKPKEYYDGLFIRFQAGSASIVSTTINVNSLGNKSISNPDGTPILSDRISSGDMVSAVYSLSLGKFILISSERSYNTVYSSSGQFYIESGSIDTFEIALSNQDIKPPIEYLDGMKVTFRSTSNNLGSSTINVNNIGAKPIIDIHGNDLVKNKIQKNCYIDAIYVESLDKFVLTSDDNYIRGSIDFSTQNVYEDIHTFTHSTSYGLPLRFDWFTSRQSIPWTEAFGSILICPSHRCITLSGGATTGMAISYGNSFGFESGIIGFLNSTGRIFDSSGVDQTDDSYDNPRLSNGVIFRPSPIDPAKTLQAEIKTGEAFDGIRMHFSIKNIARKFNNFI